MTQLPDIEDRTDALSGFLPSVRRQNGLDVLLLVLVIVLGTVAIAGSLLHVPSPLVVAAAVGLTAVSFAGVSARIMSRPDHVRALQSDRMLRIANETLGFLRQGLDAETAEAVCRIALRETEASAVAITDRDVVLAFAGVGEEHHRAGGPIITRATHEALDHNEPRVLYSKDEIGCPEPACQLRAAIVVPLEMREEPVGTLKFYYNSDRYLNETQLAMAEGLGRLLSSQLELSELERQTDLAREMELKALQAQINPHFLFNTINTIAAFIRTDPSEARRLLRQFGAFYRRTLEQADDLITLERELEYVDTYVELEQARFGDRLVLIRDIDPATRPMPMPAFMLQPLVENCIQHGPHPDGRPLTVTITASVRDDATVITVADDGVGIAVEDIGRLFEPGFGTGLGIAMRNVRDRLKGFYGRDSELLVESIPGEGVSVSLLIR